MNPLRWQLEMGNVVIGLASTYPASGLIEGMCRGWDFVWIDGQHGEYSYESILHGCQAAAGIDVDVLLRVPAYDSTMLGNYADLGPSAIMVPMVVDAHRAHQVVRALNFPPLGERSYGGRRISNLLGREYHLGLDVLFVAQIETPDSVGRASDIAAVEGVDVLFFSADDLRVSMGIPVATAISDDSRLISAMQTTADAALKEGKSVGCVVGDEESFEAAVALGYHLIVAGSDSVFLGDESSRRLGLLRGLLEGRNADVSPKGDGQSVQRRKA